MTTAFKRPVKRGRDPLLSATIREFGGGWNVIDNDLNLASRFSKVMDNVTREEDGSVGVRFGTRILAETADANWIDPSDLAFTPFDVHISAGVYKEIAPTVANPLVWHDGTFPETNAASTRIDVTGTPGPVASASLQLVGEYAASTVTDVIIVHAPSDGYVVGDVIGTTPFNVKVEVEHGGTYYVAREQTYTVGSAPASIVVKEVAETGLALDQNAIDKVRVTITVASVVKDQNVQIAVSEVDAGQYIGTGSEPAHVEIVNIFYYQNSVVTVMSNGYIIRVLGDGTSSIVWSPAIAASLAGAPAGWSDPIDFASFAVFNGDLIVCNGIDKPLLINFNSATPVQYLVDLGSGSNVNTPVGRYVLATNNYLLIAGDALNPDRVHISARNTSGTFFGDPAPNDATFIDLGKVGGQGDQTITGINRYRNQVVVTFLSACVLGTLGQYDSETPPNHTPDFDDVIEGFGGHSHRAMVNLGNDLFILDNQGVTSVARSLLSGTLEPKRVSELIDPEINKNVNRLTEADTILRAHAVYNSNDKEYMCFVPNHSETLRGMLPQPLQVVPDAPNDLQVRIPDHGLLEGDKFRLTGLQDFNDVVAATSINDIDHVVRFVINEDVVQFTPSVPVTTTVNKDLVGGGATGQWMPLWTETYGYIYTFIQELRVRAWARFRGWKWKASTVTELGTVIFADGKRLFTYGNMNDRVYKDFVGTVDERNIEFQWELPWNDLRDRMVLKRTRYLALDTEGNARFTVMMFRDNIYKRRGVLQPAIAVDYIGGDNGGFGSNGQPFGGGRRTVEERLYEWPCEGRILKVRMQGSVDSKLRIIAFSLMYHKGNIR